MKNHSLRALALCFLTLLFLSSCGPPAQPGAASAEKGVQAYTKGDYNGAIKEIQAGLNAGVSEEIKSDLWTIMGNSYDQIGKTEEAVAAHEKAIELDPKSAKAWTNLGATYRRTGDFEKAESSYQKALEIDPNYPEAHASIGALYIFQGKTEESITSLEKAIFLQNDLAVAHANIAIAYASSGKFEQAEASLTKANSLGYPNGQALRAMLDDIKSKQATK